MSTHPIGAALEVFGRLRVLPQREIDHRVLATIYLASDVRLADMTHASVVGRFGLTAEASTGESALDLPAYSAVGSPAQGGGLCRRALCGPPRSDTRQPVDRGVREGIKRRGAGRTLVGMGRRVDSDCRPDPAASGRGPAQHLRLHHCRRWIFSLTAANAAYSSDSNRARRCRAVAIAVRNRSS